MINKILAFLLFAALLVGTPTCASAENAIEIIDNEMQNTAISVSESILHVTGANGLVLEVYNVAGVRVMSVKVEGQDKKYELNFPKGCYIVKVGKLVRKISIR